MAVNEDEVPVNNIGSGNIALVDPIITKVQKRKLKGFKEFAKESAKNG